MEKCFVTKILKLLKHKSNNTVLVKEYDQFIITLYMTCDPYYNPGYMLSNYYLIFISPIPTSVHSSISEKILAQMLQLLVLLVHHGL